MSIMVDGKPERDVAAFVEDLARLRPDLANKPEARHQALHLAKSICAVLEDPVNRATDLVFQPYASIAARIAVDLDLFKHIAGHGDGISSHQLAMKSAGNEELITRVLRLLAAVDFVIELRPNTWVANATTKAMASASVSAGHRFVFDVLIESAIKAPQYLRETGYKFPTEPTDGFVQYAKQTKHDIFGFLQTHPSLFRDFNLFMGNTLGAREYWHNWYPVESRLFEAYSLSTNPNFLVDVGGGKGHDLAAFHGTFSEHGSYAGSRMVLQDRDQVLDDIPQNALPANITKMPHDFFGEQPVKGARVYFLHHILHDWADKYCHIILKHLREAMAPGFSKLIVHELVLPNRGAAEIQARFDLVMMTFNGGKERSKVEWMKLLEDAGFCNIKIWEHLDHDGIIEAEVA